MKKFSLFFLFFYSFILLFFYFIFIIEGNANTYTNIKILENIDLSIDSNAEKVLISLKN